MIPIIKQVGIYVGPSDIIDYVVAPPNERRILRVRSWANQLSPATQELVRRRAALMHATTESVFDAAHGRRYLCFVYSNKADRSRIWDYLTGEEGRDYASDTAGEDGESHYS